MPFLKGISTSAAVACFVMASGLTAHAAETCFGEQATIVGSGLIVGTAGDDVIVGSAGADEIDALAGDDRICGLAGDDVVNSGLGDDKVSGGDGYPAITSMTATGCRSTILDVVNNRVFGNSSFSITIVTGPSSLP